jgi:PAS domain S-box-containing protein
MFTYISPNVVRMIGYSKEEIYAAGPSFWNSLIHPDDVEKKLKAAKRLYEKQSPYSVEYRLRRKDGQYMWIGDRSGMSYVRDDVHYVSGVFTDISSVKNLEDQFRHAQKMEAIGQLAGGIAHDFNNLLSVILGYSDFVLNSLKVGGVTESLGNDVDEIKNAAMRAATLTRQLLLFSRRQVVRPLIMNLNAPVVEMENMLRRLIGENISLETHLDSDLENIQADPGEMEQVIMNLVVNARDAMPKGGKLTIETQNVELDQYTAKAGKLLVQPGRYAVLSISDTGIGIDDQTKLRLFEPFFTTKDTGKGTGLGLATVYGIVKKNDGTIAVESAQGKGTTFKIYLPAVDEAAQLAEKTPVGASDPVASATILVVEDEEKIRLMIRRFLSSLKYTVIEALDGNEALSVSERHKGKIDLLLTDIMMPTISGLDLAKRLQKTRPEMKVLFISGYTDQGASLSESSSNFLMKPFSPSDLQQKIKAILSAN